MTRETIPTPDTPKSELSSEAEARLKSYLDEAVELEKAGGPDNLAKALALYQQYEREFKVETGDLSPETLKETMNAFLETTFKGWGYDANQLKDAIGKTPDLLSPLDIDYEITKDDIDATKSGEYTLNPGTQTLDFETIPPEKYFVPDLSAFNSKPLAEVAEHLKQTYGAKYHLPGLEYFDYLAKNPDKTPETAKANLKDGNYYFFFGSLLRSLDGRWIVPCARWDGSGWRRDGRRLGYVWHDGYRVVLLEK